MAGRLHVDDWTRHPRSPAFRGIDPPVFSPNLAPRRWLSILRRLEKRRRGMCFVNDLRFPMTLICCCFWDVSMRPRAL